MITREDIQSFLDRLGAGSLVVMEIEPNLWLPDEGFGVKLGETVACTADGPVSLSQLPHDLIVV